jgi:hypothetical protein
MRHGPRQPAAATRSARQPSPADYGKAQIRAGHARKIRRSGRSGRPRCHRLRRAIRLLCAPMIAGRPEQRSAVAMARENTTMTA